MLLDVLGASLLVKAQLEQVKSQLELIRIFNAASSFNKF